MARGSVYWSIGVIIRVDSKTPAMGCYELIRYGLIGWLGCEWLVGWLGIVGLIGHLLGGYWVD